MLEDNLQEDKLQEEEHRHHLVLLSHSQAVHDRNLHFQISRGKLERLTTYNILIILLYISFISTRPGGGSGSYDADTGYKY